MTEIGKWINVHVVLNSLVGLPKASSCPKMIFFMSNVLCIWALLCKDASLPWRSLVHYHSSLKQLIEKDLLPWYRSFLSSCEAKCFIPWECIFIFIMEVNGVNKGNGESARTANCLSVHPFHPRRIPPVLTVRLWGNPTSSCIDTIGDNGREAIWSRVSHACAFEAYITV